MSNEKRRAARVIVNAPTEIETMERLEPSLHENLAAVYERVDPVADKAGERIPGVVRDLSSNGAFITGEPLPLLSRVAFSFPLTGYGQIDAIGWVLWRRTDDCEIPNSDGDLVKLDKGFGVLFEALPLDARVAIHELVRANTE